MKVRWDCDACVLIVLALFLVVVLFGWYWLGTMSPASAQVTAAWTQAIGSIGAILVAVWVSLRESRQHDHREAARLAETRKALALSLLRRVRERARDIELMILKNEVEFPDIEWRIPEPLADNADITPFIPLGDEFLNALSRLHDLRRQRQMLVDRSNFDAHVSSLEDLEPPPEIEEVNEHLQAVRAALREIEMLLESARDGHRQ
jgi:hypothetical protein